MLENEMLSQYGPGENGFAPAPKIRDFPDVPDLLTLEVEPVSWLVERMIPRAAVTLVAGEPGSYKSWLALCLGRSVAEGSPFLGASLPAVAGALPGQGKPPGRGARTHAGAGHSIGRAAARLGRLAGRPTPAIGDARLLQIAREWKPLFVFDSLIRFHDGDENSATEMSPVMGDLRALANAGATVVALHHRAKSEASRYRGSSDILGGVDVAIAVSRDHDAGLIKLQCFKSRFDAEFAVTLRPELESAGGFALAEPSSHSRESSDVETLRRVIATQPGLSQRDVVKRAGLPQSRGIELLRKDEGLSWRSERGPHGAIQYHLLSPADQDEPPPPAA